MPLVLTNSINPRNITRIDVDRVIWKDADPPTVPDDYAIVVLNLTANNGAVHSQVFLEIRDGETPPTPLPAGWASSKQTGTIKRNATPLGYLDLVVQGRANILNAYTNLWNAFRGAANNKGARRTALLNQGITDGWIVTTPAAESLGGAVT